MQMPRLVFGETSRERELRALADALQAERDRRMRKIVAIAKVHDASLAALREKVEMVIAERDEARRERDELKAPLAIEKADGNYLAGRLTTAEAERDEARRLLKVAAYDRDEARRDWDRAIQVRNEAWGKWDELAGRLKIAEAERDGLASRREAAERDASDLRLTLKIVVRNLRKLADDIEPTDESPEDRPATDSGAEGAGTTPE